MAKELCHRCGKPVYPTDKVGPLKDGAFFHNGCFKCYICGTRLALKTYCNNRNDIDDGEVYCGGHVPNANPHDPLPLKSKPNGNTKSDQIPSRRGDAGLEDMKIAHAMKATNLAKPYPKIKHEGAKYAVDYDAQTRLELMHRCVEDDLYRHFDEERAKELQQFDKETKEEWEKALTDFARRFEKGHSDPSQKEDLIRQLTIRRDKKLETMTHRRKERERMKTTELFDHQANEMLDLFRQARQSKVSFLSKNPLFQHENHEIEESTSSSSTSYPSTPPPPMPPSCSKRHIYSDASVFEQIDQIAISVAQSEVSSFTDLVRILTAGARSDVDKARAIYRWITVKNLNVMVFDEGIDKDTPMGLLRGIKYGTESYHVLFKRLCSYAGLHCVVIKGYSKSAGYQPGLRFDDNRFRNTWNAVFLDGSWRFVQCNWGARHLVFVYFGKHPTFRNAKGTPNKETNLRYQYDDFYFLPNPEEFIYEFFPMERAWQLLPRPITMEQFEQLPFVRSLFFHYGLHFVDSAIQSVIRTDSAGAASVTIGTGRGSAQNIIFHYNLRFYDGEETEIDGLSLKRFVLQSSKSDSITFRIHSPTTRPLLLDIFANAVDTEHYLSGNPIKFKSICKFKIVCNRLDVIMVPLPECASGEWGPAKAYRLFNLIPLSHEDAIINCGQYCEIRFRMTKPLAEFVAALHKNGVDDRQLTGCVQATVHSDNVTISLEFPDEGQYGIDIYTRDSSQPMLNGKQLLTHCTKYLINSRVD